MNKDLIKQKFGNAIKKAIQRNVEPNSTTTTHLRNIEVSDVPCHRLSDGSVVLDGITIRRLDIIDRYTKKG